MVELQENPNTGKMDGAINVDKRMLYLPRPLFVAVGVSPLATLMLVHLQAAFLF